MHDVDVRMIIHYAEASKDRCNDENWFPDDTSKKNGYLEALDDLLVYLKGLQ